MGQTLSGAARIRRRGGIGAAFLVAGLTSLLPGRHQGPLADFSTVTVGEVTAIARPADLDLAVSLAEAADRPLDWYGIGPRKLGQVALVLVRGDPDFAQVARGRVPGWGAGLAIPAARFIVIRADGEDPFQILRHELAHLALHQELPGRVPLWFSEGYAVLAAGELDRFAQLGLNLTVARGRIPPLGGLNNALRADRSTAETAYALAGSAVAFLADRTQDRSLEPLFARMRSGLSFDSSVALSTGYTEARFESAWRKELKRRYGIGLWLGAGGLWFGVIGLVLVAYWLRRRRDRPRRAQLDIGWDVASSDDELAPEGDERA